MRDSSAYQAILEEGAERGRTEGQIEEARRLLLRWGTKRLGIPDAATEAAVRAITDLGRLELLLDRLQQNVASWAELLQLS
jgi:hypothetical protein